MKRTWHTATGENIPFDKLDHQHLSNIIWYYRLLFNHEHKIMINLLNERFEFKLLDFKPLPIQGEIRALHLKGLILNNGDIIMSIGGFEKYAVVGSVTHIENWKDLTKHYGA
jgi:hypothetical protein